MKIDKIQMDLLKAWYKDDRKFNTIYRYGEHDGNICVTDQHGVYIIPKSLFVLDLRIFDSTPLDFERMGLLKLEQDSRRLDYKYSIEQKDTKATVNVLKFDEEDGEEVWINKKLLRYFDEKYPITYRGINKKSPVFVYEDGVMVGIVLPIKPV